MAKKGRRLFSPDRHCGAKTRTGRPCVRGKGERTSHLGQGRCWKHGGRAPIKHGLYSTIRRDNIKQLLERVRASTDDPLDLISEIELLRALVVDFTERFDEMSASLLSWHTSFSEALRTLLSSNDAIQIKRAIVQLRESTHNRPAQILDITAVSALIERIGRMAERLHKMKSEGAISLETLKRIMESMAVVVARHCDPETCLRVESEWQAIRVER